MTSTKFAARTAYTRPLGPVKTHSARVGRVYKRHQTLLSVTTTHAGSSDYDQLVILQLGVQADTEGVLSSGIGCAGDLANLRVAANMYLTASRCGQPAGILGFASWKPQESLSFQG